MVENSRSRISFNDAREQVGRAIYGDAWIVSLTEHEKWLVKRYVEGRSGDRASTMPGQTTYDFAGCKWAEYPGSPELLAKATSARDRRDCSKEQGDEVCDWLEDHGFDSDASSFDRDALLGELEKEFPSTPAMSAAASNTETQNYQTGAPGRTPSRSLLEIEFRHPIWDEDEDLKNSSWVLPEGVTGEMIRRLPDEGLYLSNVVRLLIGNKEEEPADVRELLLWGARGERFAKVLFKAVAHGEIIISGSRDGVHQKIPQETFELPYSLVVGNDDAIGPDIDRWPKAQSWELVKDLGKYRALQWHSVTVERNSLAKWVDLPPLQHILNCFRRGELTKDEADAEARRHGFDSLERRLDEAQALESTPKELSEEEKYDAIPPMSGSRVNKIESEIIFALEKYRLGGRHLKREDGQRPVGIALGAKIDRATFRRAFSKWQNKPKAGRKSRQKS